MDHEDCERLVRDLRCKKEMDELFCIDIHPDRKNFRRIIFAGDIATSLDDGLLFVAWSDGEKEGKVLPSSIKEIKLVKSEQCAQSFNELTEGIRRLIHLGVQGAIDSLKQ